MPAEKTAPFETRLKAAYHKAPEAVKKRMFEFLQKFDHRLFEQWRDAAKLKGKYPKDKSLLQRPADVRHPLDSALFGKYMTDKNRCRVVCLYIQNTHPEWTKWAEKHFEGATPATAPMLAESLANSGAMPSDGHPDEDLLLALIFEHPRVFIEESTNAELCMAKTPEVESVFEKPRPATPIRAAGDSTAAQTAPSMAEPAAVMLDTAPTPQAPTAAPSSGWETALADYKDHIDRLGTLLAAARRLIPIDCEAARAAIDQILLKGDQLRLHMDKACKAADRDAPAEVLLDEYGRLLGELEQAAKGRARDKILRRRLASLSHCLQAIEDTYPTNPRKKAQLEEARLAAIAELDAARGRTPLPELPGKESGQEWLAATFALDAEGQRLRKECLGALSLQELVNFIDEAVIWTRFKVREELLPHPTEAIPEPCTAASPEAPANTVAQPQDAASSATPPAAPATIYATPTCAAYTTTTPAPERSQYKSVNSPSLAQAPALGAEPPATQSTAPQPETETAPVPTLAPASPCKQQEPAQAQAQPDRSARQPARKSEQASAQPAMPPAAPSHPASTESTGQAPDTSDTDSELFLGELLKLDAAGEARILIPDLCKAWARLPLLSNLPHQLWELLLLGEHIVDPESAEAAQAKALIQELADRDWTPMNALEAELAWAATSLPAFLGASSEASMILNQLHEARPDPKLMEVVRPILTFITAVPHCTIERIRSGTNHHEWERRLRDLRNGLIQACDLAKDQRINFQKATLVWQYLNRPADGKLRLIAEKAQRLPDMKVALELTASLRELEDLKSRSRLIEATTFVIGGKGAQEIDGVARQKLHDNIQNFCTQVRAVMDHAERQPKMDRFLNEHLQRLTKDALPHLNNYIAHQESLQTAGFAAFTAAQTLRSARRISELFTHTPQRPPMSMDPAILRPISRARMRGLPLHGSASRTMSDDLSVLRSALRHDNFLPISEAILHRAQTGDIASARLLLGLVQGAGDRESLTTQVENQSSEYARRAYGLLHTTRNDVITARTLRTLEDSEAQEYLTLLVEAQHALEKAENYMRPLDQIERIKEALSERIRTTASALEAELAGTVDITPELKKRIRSLLDHHDLATANEYLTRLRTGQQLPSWELEPLLFNSGLSEPISKACAADSGLDGCLRQLRTRGKFGGIDFSNLSQEQIAETSTWLEAWKRLKSGPAAPALQTWLEGLGFSVKNIAGNGELDVMVEPIVNRDLCAVSAFGSLAKGRYRVLVISIKQEAQLLVQKLSGGAPGRATVLLVTYPITRGIRLEFARLCREKGQRGLLVDETLCIFLSGLTSGRMKSFFQSTLPYTWVDPYSPTSSLVAPELFFGRAEAMEQLLDMGQQRCFVYGGRQLGKTALLREVERRFNSPANHAHAVWIDLQAHEFGRDSEPSEIWGKLEQLLRDLPEFEPELRRQRATSNGARIQGALNAWLKANEERKLLLLLDESDVFLDLDATKDFVETRRLKGLMDSSNKRIKVVFAGLHNVQRFTSHPNHPLAHLGSAINIGAFSENDEWLEAYNLVVKPLAALGYHFETVDLPSRVLTACNFYPGLLQQFGYRLLDRMRTRPPQEPAYTIRSVDVDEVLRENVFRDFMMERFQLTLQLDPRYHYLAYLFAFLFHDAPEAAARGLTVDFLMQQAISYRPKEFASMNRDDFATILDEMRGLGIFHSDARKERFRLRNTNVLLLLGAREVVETRLTEDLKQVRMDYKTATCRGQAPNSAKGPHRRRWLTRPEENRLFIRKNQLTLIGGIPLAESASFTESLLAAANALNGNHELLKLASAELLATKVGTLVGKSANADINLVQVIATLGPINRKWVEAAAPVIGKHSSVHFTSLVYQLGNDMIWSEEGRVILQYPGVQHCFARRWEQEFVAPWLQQQNIGLTPEILERIIDITDGWPDLLHTVAEKLSAQNAGNLADSCDVLKKAIGEQLAAPNAHHHFVGTSREGTEAWSALRELSSHGRHTFTADDIGAAEEMLGVSREKLLHWMDVSVRLDLLTSSGGTFRCTPLVARTMQQGTR